MLVNVGSVVSFVLQPLLTGCTKIWSYDDQIKELNTKAGVLKGIIRDFVQEYPTSESEDVIISSRAWCTQATELVKQCHGRVLNPQIRYQLSDSIRRCVQDYETLKSALEYHVQRKEKRTEGSADGFRTAGGVDQAVIIYEEQPLPGKIVGSGVEMLCKEVIHELLTDAGKMWVGIWGTGGVGKTTLAKMINNDIEVQNHFGKNIIWITFGNEWSHEQVRKQLQSKVRAMQLSLGADENSAKIALHKAVRDKRVLFILDDVWVADPLELFDVIKMPSRILLTTRNQHVIDSKHGKGFKAEFLSQEESIKLFKFKAFGDETPQNAKVLETAEKMAQECDGLPLLIELTGSCMSEHKDSGEKQPDDFRKRDQDFKGVEDKLFNKMKLSFDELKNIRSFDGVKVQECFLYMAAFPEDFRIHLDTLAKCWRGEDLVGIDAEEEAADILRFLNGRSLVQYDIRNRFTRVHDVVRHLCIRIWKERGREGMYLCGHDAKDDEVCRGRRWKRASLIHSSEKVRDGMYVTDVLLLDGNTAYEKLDSHFFKRVSTTLKVLSLSGTGVTSLSNKIRKLTNLRTLDLKDTKLSNIPRDIFSLRQLRYFNLTGTVPVFMDNRQIQALKKLSCLEHLALVFESIGGAMDMSSVATLHHLRFLDLRCRTRDSLMVFSQGLGLLKHLQLLGLEAGRLDIRSISESDLTNLRICELMGTVDGDLGTLLKSSCKLEKLLVEDINNPVEQAATAQDLTWMQSFSEINYLSLMQGVDFFSLPSLPKLESLRLRVSSSSGEPPKLGKRTFPCLEKMTLEFGHAPYNDIDDFMAMEMNKLSRLRLVVTGTWKHLPLSVTSLTSLTFLDMEGNVERLLPENHASTGGCFPSGLDRLVIEGSENSQCPDDFFEPGGYGIKRLEIAPGRRWQHMLPQSVYKLTHLNDLRIYTQIHVVREYENNMESMFGGGIEDDDSKFSKLVELSKLKITGKGLRQLPRSVARLPLLETLEFFFCPTLEKVIADGDDESADNADENLFPSLKKLFLEDCGSPFIPLTLKNRSDVKIIRRFYTARWQASTDTISPCSQARGSTAIANPAHPPSAENSRWNVVPQIHIPVRLKSRPVPERESPSCSSTPASPEPEQRGAVQSRPGVFCRSR